MLQEQPLPFISTSPETLSMDPTLLSPYIVTLDENAIEDDLKTEYSIYRNHQKRISVCTQFRHKISRFCSSSYVLVHQLWNEIIPQHLRGRIKNKNLRMTEISTTKDRLFFEEYRKKKARFFLILFDDTCHEEQMQEAYEKASFIAVQGRGIRVGELIKQTNCTNWRIPNMGTFKKYVVLFFKLDLFGNLLNFGHMSKQLIDANKEDENFLQNFKEHMVDTYERYEVIEKQFTSSYLEKEDRLAFE